MYKMTLSYEDFDGNARTEDFYFNLTKAEIQQMAYSVDGGLDNLIKKIVQTRDYSKLVALIKDLILKSYGEKSPDGRRFDKSEDIVKGFSQTQAFSDIYMELSSDDKKLLEFVKGVIPKDVAVEAEKQLPPEQLSLLHN